MIDKKKKTTSGIALADSYVLDAPHLNRDVMLLKLYPYLRTGIIVGLLAFGANANALQVDLDVDFRDGSIWSESNSSNGGVTVSGSPNQLYRDDQDGYGIRGGENDEIDRNEILIVDFDNDYYDSHGAIIGILVTDLFDAPDGSGAGESGWVEVFLLDGSSFVVRFAQDTSDPNGEYYVDLGASYEVARFEFHASAGAGQEYSVAGFVQVSEPGTLAILGFGLLMIATLRRRRPVPA